MTTDFQSLLNTWSNHPSGRRATPAEVYDLLEAAKQAKALVGELWAWKTLERHLVTFAGYDKKDAASEARKVRVIADLGQYPKHVGEFVPLWLQSRGYTINFSGQVYKGRVEKDITYCAGEMYVWTQEHHLFEKTHSPVLANWLKDEKERVLQRAYATIAHDPTLDPDHLELQRFVRMVVAEDDDPAIAERNYKAAEVAIANTIWRIKNHLRKVWRHHAHLMVVFYGEQKDGKSSAVKHLFSPIADLMTDVGFDIFDHDAKMYELSIVPIFLFDELAGVGKADIEKIKGIMTTEKRMLKQLYERASMRTLVTTFIGCTNRDLKDLIRDETGNRRYVQFRTRKIDVKGGELKQIDALKILRSIDENLEVAPALDMIAETLIEDVQAEQRHTSPVEDWLMTVPSQKLPLNRWCKSGEIWEMNFYPWLQANYPDQVRFWNVKKLGGELTRLATKREQKDGFTINTKEVKRSNSYYIERSTVIEHPIKERVNELAAARGTRIDGLTLDEDGWKIEGETLEEPMKARMAVQRGLRD